MDAQQAQEKGQHMQFLQAAQDAMMIADELEDTLALTDSNALHIERY